MKYSSLGDIFQLAYVASDLHSAVDFWTKEMGVGPFFEIPRVEDFLTGAEYYGKPSNIHFSAAVSYWGDRQIEIIVPTNDAASIYRDWLRSGRTGLHHVSIEVAGLEPGRQIALSAGNPVAQELTMAGGGGVIYIDVGEAAEVRYIELYQFGPGQREMFARARAAAQDWDGSDPLRPMA